MYLQKSLLSFVTQHPKIKNNAPQNYLQTQGRNTGDSSFVEHPKAIRAMANLQLPGKYTEAEKVEIQNLVAQNRIHEVEDSNIVKAITSLGATCHKLGKYNRQRNWRSKFCIQETEFLY